MQSLEDELQGLLPYFKCCCFVLPVYYSEGFKAPRLEPFWSISPLAKLLALLVFLWFIYFYFFGGGSSVHHYKIGINPIGSIGTSAIQIGFDKSGWVVVQTNKFKVISIIGSKNTKFRTESIPNNICTYTRKPEGRERLGVLHKLEVHFWIIIFLYKRQNHALVTSNALTQGSLTTSNRVIIFGPPCKLSKILISRLIFFFLTGWTQHSNNSILTPWHSVDTTKIAPRRIAHLQYFDHCFHIVGDIDRFKYFTILSSTKLLDYLIVVLIPANNRNNDKNKGRNT